MPLALAPLLTEVTGYSAAAVPWVMVLLGVGMLAGGPFGGRYADRALMPSVYALLAAIIAVSAVLLAAAHNRVAVVVALTVFGVVASATIPPLQTRVLDKAVGAQALASAANVAAFNLGNTVGPFLAGLAISAGFGFTSPLWVGALLGAAGLAVALLSGALDRRTPPAPATELTGNRDAGASGARIQFRP
ncbi:MFS transporter [Spirillospora sp. CA-255316]